MKTLTALANMLVWKRELTIDKHSLPQGNVLRLLGLHVLHHNVLAGASFVQPLPRVGKGVVVVLGQQWAAISWHSTTCMGRVRGQVGSVFTTGLSALQHTSMQL